MQQYATHILVFLVDEVPELASKTLFSLSLSFLRRLSHKTTRGQVFYVGWMRGMLMCNNFLSHVH